jgi:hypothetical protein
MARKRYLPEQIIGYLREVEVLLSKGSTVPQMCRKIGIAEQTYYRYSHRFFKSLNQGYPNYYLNYVLFDNNRFYNLSLYTRKTQHAANYKIIFYEGLA